MGVGPKPSHNSHYVYDEYKSVVLIKIGTSSAVKILMNLCKSSLTHRVV